MYPVSPLRFLSFPLKGQLSFKRVYPFYFSYPLRGTIIGIRRKGKNKKKGAKRYRDTGIQAAKGYREETQLAIIFFVSLPCIPSREGTQPALYPLYLLYPLYPLYPLKGYREGTQIAIIFCCAYLFKGRDTTCSYPFKGRDTKEILACIPYLLQGKGHNKRLSKGCGIRNILL